MWSLISLWSLQEVCRRREKLCLIFAWWSLEWAEDRNFTRASLDSCSSKQHTKTPLEFHSTVARARLRQSSGQKLRTTMARTSLREFRNFDIWPQVSKLEFFHNHSETLWQLYGCSPSLSELRECKKIEWLESHLGNMSQAWVISIT